MRGCLASAVLGAATFLFAVLLDSVLEGGELTSWDRPVLDRLAMNRHGGLTAATRLVPAGRVGRAPGESR